MKKIIIRASVLVLIPTLIIGMFSINAFADENKAQYVYDPAYLLTDEEYAELNDLAAEISEKYQCAVHFVTDDNPELNLDNIQMYAEDLYLSSPVLGWGESKDGFMLVLGTADRCYW
ncbi:MAG: TPM domain-containing protein, partial [Firmicutes bacterium]|nr:TPM domain-containing protein [Bacillota bacterium]